MTEERELSAGLHGRVTGRAGIAYRMARMGWRIIAACLRVRSGSTASSTSRVRGRSSSPACHTGPGSTRSCSGAGCRRSRASCSSAMPGRWAVRGSGARSCASSAASSRSRRRTGRARPTRTSRPPPRRWRRAQRSVCSPRRVRRRRCGPSGGWARASATSRSAAVCRSSRSRSAATTSCSSGGRSSSGCSLPMSALELAGLGEPPQPGSPEEREAVHRVLDGLAAGYATAVGEVHDASEPPPGTRKRLTWLTTLFR